MKITAWADGVPILEGQRIRYSDKRLAQISWIGGCSAYVNFDDHCYGTYRFDHLLERFTRVGSTGANARSACIFRMLANCGWAPSHAHLWWGLDRYWRPLMGIYADELEVREFVDTPPP